MSLPRATVPWMILVGALVVAETCLAGAAVDTLRRRAQDGAADAQYCLGILHEAGALRDVPRDHGQAARWYLRASEQGHPYAQISLGYLYARGSGIPPDNVLALSWLEIGAAAAQGPPRAAAKAARDRLIPRMSLREIIEAQHKRRAWMTSRGELAASDSPGASVLASRRAP